MGLVLLGKFRVLFLRPLVSRRLYLNAAAMKNLVPDRWTEYNAVGKRIPGTRFIAFKVPLKKLFDNKLAPSQRFSPTDLISEVEKQNEQLGLIVDLTCTKRYYSAQELPKTLEYFKIFTVGHQVPTDDVIDEFKGIVKQFISENSDNDKLIGVHCTHGLNRTGYLVCRYMIDVLGMLPSDAIEEFNKSRGHCIERKNYLDDLLRGKTKKNPESMKTMIPQPRYQQHIPKMNDNFALGFRPPLYQQELQWLPGNQYAHSNLGHHAPEPRCGFPQTRGRPPGHPFSDQRPAPWMPPPVVQYPPMLGPRHHVPQMENDLPQHFRRGPRHPHHKRPFPQHQGGWQVNGSPVQDFALHTPQQYGGNAKSREAQGFGSQRHGYSIGPYKWVRGQGSRRNSQQQWQ